MIKKLKELRLSTWLLRIPIVIVFIQQGLSKFPVTLEDAQAFDLPYIVWWFVTCGEIGAAVGRMVGGLFSLIPWYNKHFFITRLSTPYVKEVIYNIGDLITRFSGITMTCIATGVIWILSPDNIWDVIYKDYLHVSLYVGGLYFALRGNVKV